jgi:hypothetical protein
MRLRRLAAVALGAALLTGGSAIWMAAPALAAGSEVCGNASTGYCLNDWGNGGSQNPVKMYYGGTVNNDFIYQLEYICNGGDIVTATCPFQHAAFNNAYRNYYILEIKYMNPGPGQGLCVATNASAHTVLGKCAEQGAQNGVIMIAGYSCTFGGFQGQYLVDRYWTDFNDTTTTLTSGGNPGVQAYFATGENSCWN